MPNQTLIHTSASAPLTGRALATDLARRLPADARRTQTPGYADWPAAGHAGGEIVLTPRGARLPELRFARRAPAEPTKGAPAAASETAGSAAAAATETSAAQPAAGREARPAPTTPGAIFRDCPDCPELVVVPAGEFSMGSPSSEAGRTSDEGPQHRVSVPTFAAGKFEVTRSQFAAFVQATGYRTRNTCWTFEDGKLDTRSDRDWRNPGYVQGDNHPVSCVSWDDAQAYVAWLREKTKQPYRLLSEAEWEYAARAGRRSARPWGESAEGACAHANVMDAVGKRQIPGFTWEAHACSDGSAYTAAVGSYKPNAFGLYDMLGNVWEWTADCWNNSYVGAPGDGSAWTRGDCGRRVVRGGSWVNAPEFARAACRLMSGAGSRDAYSGFRLARTLP